MADIDICKQHNKPKDQVEGAPGARRRGLQSRGEERAAASQQRPISSFFRRRPLMHDQEERSPSLGRADTSTYRDPHSGDGVHHRSKR